MELDRRLLGRSSWRSYHSSRACCFDSYGIYRSRSCRRSVAAATQSAVYGGYVASGSAFALAQSAGAAGVGIKGAAGLFSATAAGTFYARNDEE